jgi:hypothetical protein
LIDSAVPNYLDLVAGVRSGLEVVALEAARNGLDINAATILGTPVGDRLSGTERADQISGLAGNDELLGLGDERLEGSTGE